MLLSLLLGALLYGLIQFFWYSPLCLGTEWSTLKQGAPDHSDQTSLQLSGMPASVQALVIPALLMSAAINALFVVIGRLGAKVYFGSVAGLFLLSIARKYTGWSNSLSLTRTLWYIQDGALLTSLFFLALLVFSLGHTLY